MNLLAELERLLVLQGELHGLAQVMVGVLERQDLEALQDAWEKRRALFEEVAACHRGLGPAFSRWEESLAALAPDQARRAQGLVDEASAQARQVLELDERAAAMMEDQLGQIGLNLKHVSLGRRTLKAYGPPPLGAGCPLKVSRTG